MFSLACKNTHRKVHNYLDPEGQQEFLPFQPGDEMYYVISKGHLEDTTPTENGPTKV